jgi:site-specific recombinase XerD
MSLQARRELLLSLRPQYVNASPREKKKLLNGFVAATGYNRKHAVTLLSKGINKKGEGRRKRKRKYDQAVVDALLIVWKAAYRVCSKRLIPFMPILVDSLIRHGHLDISETVKKQLLSVSPATADRLLVPERRKSGKGLSTTKPGYLIKKHIPIRTFADWNDVAPGFLEADLVAHCGENVRGQFLNTLTMTDIATGWTELGALMGKSERDVLQEMAEIKELLPFSLLGVDTDNGGEFINYGLVEWCSKNNITFTRSREYKKNDQAHVEQKNGSIVRHLIGYDRYEGIESWQLLSQLYRIARLYINFFQPCLKLISKWRDGARVHKRYDTAKTPYQRILISATVTEESKERLRKIFPSLDPMLLLQEMERLQMDLWKTAVGQDQSQQITEEHNKTTEVTGAPHKEDGTQSEPSKIENMTLCNPPTPTRRRPKPVQKSTSLEQHKPLSSDSTKKPVSLEAPAALNTAPPHRKGSGSSVLAVLVERFLDDQQRKHQRNTVSSYRDSLRLLLQFMQLHLRKEVSELDITDIDTSLVCAFLDDMENREISASSRNLRLVAVRVFCRYARLAIPSQSSVLDGILAIPAKQYKRPSIDFLTAMEIEALLAAPDRTTWCGRRDHAFLCVAQQTGLLVSEMTALRRQDVELTEAAHVRVFGAGRKERRVPLTKLTATVLEDWLQEPVRCKAKTLFPNARGGRLTADGVRYFLNTHIGAASDTCPSLQDKQVTPFLLRHTAAMQLLQSGMSRETLAQWLGLESVASTQPYLDANLAIKKEQIRNRRTSTESP